MSWLLSALGYFSTPTLQYPYEYSKLKVYPVAVVVTLTTVATTALHERGNAELESARRRHLQYFHTRNTLSCTNIVVLMHGGLDVCQRSESIAARDIYDEADRECSQQTKHSFLVQTTTAAVNRAKCSLSPWNEHDLSKRNRVTHPFVSNALVGGFQLQQKIPCF